MESPSINFFSIPLLSIGFNNHSIFVVWFIYAFFFLMCFCVCMFGKQFCILSCFLRFTWTKTFSQKAVFWVSFLPCPLWNQNPHFMIESSVCDIPAPRHCSSWWCHKWRIMILAGGTDEVRRNKRSSLLAAVPSRREMGVGGEALSLWHSWWQSLSPCRTLWKQQGVAAEILTDCSPPYPTPIFLF